MSDVIIFAVVERERWNNE